MTKPSETQAADSEREEGEIVDDLDDLSEFSSGEEYLLRERLQVFENYNNVLERKQAKGSHYSERRSKKCKFPLLNDLSEISGSEFDENVSVNSPVNVRRSKPIYYKEKRKKVKLTSNNNKVSAKTKQKFQTKKKLESRFIPESSEDEEDLEVIRKKRKLADAVTIGRDHVDKTSLKARLMNMLKNNTSKRIKNLSPKKISDNLNILHRKPNIIAEPNKTNNGTCVDTDECVDKNCEKIIDLCEIESTETDSTLLKEGTNSIDTEKLTPKVVSDSEEDLETLRQHALQSKSAKTMAGPVQSTVNMQSEDEDSDTKELRLICLKSSILKKAIEMKRKQRLRKRLSQSSQLGDILSISPTMGESNNNTDIESVDMDLGISDGQDDENDKVIVSKSDDTKEIMDIINNTRYNKVEGKNNEDDFEEDEDLLRAKLLSSLSNNLPRLVTVDSPVDHTGILTETRQDRDKNVKIDVTKVPEKRFIINTKDSDSGSDTEATKNLTKMHNKLVPLDFQQRLDVFLKSTRQEVESSVIPHLNSLTPDTTVDKQPQKFIPKALHHLPKSEQQEYNNLVKRMVELEKLKEARQQSMSNLKKSPIVYNNFKDALKPRNISNDNNTLLQNMEEQISLSRKKIAEESARVLNLKEERKKLSQKYKIVTTELKNLSTAITLTDRQMRQAQAKLSKMTAQHQLLLKRSGNNLWQKKTLPSSSVISNHNDKISQISKPSKPMTQYIIGNKLNMDMMKAVKVSVVNDLADQNVGTIETLSITVDVSDNKPEELKQKSPVIQETPIVLEESLKNNNKGKNTRVENNALERIVVCKVHREDGRAKHEAPIEKRKRKSSDDYQSPLQALLSATWNEDPHGVLCPFEVAGMCKDADCKYLHTKIPPLKTS